MVNVNPLWVDAVGTAMLAAESGVAMLNRKSAEKTATAAPTPVNVVVQGITGQEYLIGMFLLALAMLGAALIIHHGLTA
jgi:hypothetical protein